MKPHPAAFGGHPPLRGGIAQGFVDHGEDTFEVAIDLVVPEAQYLKAAAGEVIVALFVAPGMGINVVLAAVDLEDEAMLEAEEIQDVAVERSLPAEVESSLSP